MRMKLLFIVAIAACLPAKAQVTVLGSGLARDCYLSVLSNRNVTRDVLNTCTKALQHENLARLDKAGTYVNRGILYMRNGNYNAALEDYDRALRLLPDLGEAYLNRGAAFIYMDEHEDAVTALNRAIELGSRDIYIAYYNRGMAHERLGLLNEAYADYSKALELNPEFERAARQLDRFILEPVESEDKTPESPSEP